MVRPNFKVDFIYDSSIIDLVNNYVDYVLQNGDIISIGRWLDFNDEWKKLSVNNKYTIIVSMVNDSKQRSEIFYDYLLIDYRPFDSLKVNDTDVLAEKLIFKKD